MTETPSFECGKFYPGQGPGNRRDREPPITPKRHPRRRRRDGEPWGPKGPIRDRPPTRLILRVCWVCKERPATDPEGFSCARDGTPVSNGPCRCRLITDRFCERKETWVPDLPGATNCPVNEFQSEPACASVCRDGVQIVCPEQPCLYYLCCIKEENEQRVPCPQYGPGCTCPLLQSANCQIYNGGTVAINEQCPPITFGGLCPNGDRLLGYSLNSTEACNAPWCADVIGPPICPGETTGPATPVPIGPGPSTPGPAGPGPSTRGPTDQICPPRTCYHCVNTGNPTTGWFPCTPPNNPLCRCRIRQDRECRVHSIQQGTFDRDLGRCVYPPTTGPGPGFYGCEPNALATCQALCRDEIEEDCGDRERVGPLTPGPGPSTPGGPTGPGPATPGPGPSETGGTTTITKTCRFCIQTPSTGTIPCPQFGAGCRCAIIYNRECKLTQVNRRPDGTFPECASVLPAGLVVNSAPYSNCAANDGSPCERKLGEPVCPEEPRPLGETGGTPIPQVKTYYVCIRENASTGGTILIGGCVERRATSKPPGAFENLQACEAVCSRPRTTPIDGPSTTGGPVPLVQRYSCNTINGKCRQLTVPQNQTAGTYGSLAQCESDCRARQEGDTLSTAGDRPDPISTFFKCNKSTGTCAGMTTTLSFAQAQGYFTTLTECRLRCQSNTAEVDRLSRQVLGGLSQRESGGGIISDPTQVRNYFKCVNNACISTIATPTQAQGPEYHLTFQSCRNYCNNDGPVNSTSVGAGIQTEPVILDDGGADDNGPIFNERLPDADTVGEVIFTGNNNPSNQNPADINVGTRPFYELPENAGAGVVNLDPAVAVYVPPTTDYNEAVVYNFKLTNLFSNTIHESIAYYLDKNNTSEDWRSYYSSDLTIYNIEKSLKPSVIRIFENITDQLGNLIGKDYFLDVIRRKLINGTIETFDISYYRKLAENRTAKTIVPEKTQDQVANTLKAFAYLENNLIPLDETKSTGRTAKITPLIKVLASDLEKSLTVEVDGQPRKYYINDDDIVIGRANLKISDGDYIEVGLGVNQRRIYLDTEKDHAYLIRDIDKMIALELLNGDSSIILTVSSPYTSNLEYNYSLSGERENVYFLKLKTETVETIRTTEYIDTTKARYDLCSISTEQDLSAINEYVKFKANHYMFPVHPDDVFIDYVVSSGHIYLQQQDIRFDGHARKTNKNVPLLVRQLPWYILLFPTNKEENNPFDIQSELIQFQTNGTNIRELIYELSIDKSEYDANITTTKFVDLTTTYPDPNVIGEYELDARKVIFDPSSTFFRSGYKDENKSTVRPKTPLRKIKEIISELNSNYVLDRGLTTFDVFSRLPFTDFNKFISSPANKTIFERIKSGAVDNIQIYEVTKYSGDAYLNKTALLKRRAAATEDSYPQLRSMNSGQYIEPPTQTEPAKILTSAIKQIKPLQ